MQGQSNLILSPDKNDDNIVVKGARVHNLKNIDVLIPRDALTVITGLSGSGKSSLAFDTVYAEGQRRYVESLSTYARQFFEIPEKPEVDSIDGLSPTISIQQKTTSHNPRSTVGTVTEVYDYLRLLFSKVSTAHCHECGKPITSQTTDQIIEQILSLPEESRLLIMAPLVRGHKGEYQKEIQSLRQKGFSRIRIDGEMVDLTAEFSLDKNKKHDIDVAIDRLILKKPPGGPSVRIFEAIELALKIGQGLVRVVLEDKKEEKLFSRKFACIDCGHSYPEPEPRTFSFNSPLGACAECDGLGYFKENPSESNDEEKNNEEKNNNTPPLITYSACPACNGGRLKKESLNFKIEKHNIAQLSAISIDRLHAFFIQLNLSERKALIADRILKELKSRLHFLLSVGCDYLSLDRSAQTLSGGESQRIRLAAQIGSSLTGVTYVLDEPSIGLHPRDNHKLLATLKHLRDMGNTVLVVEHDQDTIKTADHIIDLGVGAGTHGGRVVANGSLDQLMKSKDSLTAKYLNGSLKIEVPNKRRKTDPNDSIKLSGVRTNNLKCVNAEFPLGTLICITGVSGSGKSTLVIDTLYPLLMNRLYKTMLPKLDFKSITGHEKIDKIVDIDQSPIGRTPRSNPATYTGLFTFIRDLYAQLPESKMRGFKPGRFSFNVKGGRCEKCQGSGMVRVELHFLSDIYVGCDECDGRRFNDETLSIKYRDKSIADVLNMTIDDATVLFEPVAYLAVKLKTLASVGLGYITLGQSALTLSGGEAQRMKLAKELAKRATGNTFYILDEPSTGLHFDDVKKLLDVLGRLVDQGNTVVIIEHNLDIIKTADYIIDLGPAGGQRGGEIIATGTPEEIVKNPASVTGKHLEKIIQP